MRADDFFLLINEIDDALVIEAHGEEAAFKKSSSIKGIVAAAACFSALFIGIFLIAKIRTNDAITPGNSAVAESVSSSPSSSSSSFTSSKDDVSSEPAMFFKEPKPEDHVYDVEHNVSYVKNQLLISASLGAPKEEIARIVEELGAEIVGYIELTNDYQIEFRTDKTLDELQSAADYIDSFSFVRGVTLNLILEMNSDLGDRN